ncbi:hypothetical protein DL93DRAFT_2079107 [Clavulina sp. PMI_390]|nr:hypothetical protein DL93DRAFT_2079107 [Clavulina sp. PMI_390]
MLRVAGKMRKRLILDLSAALGLGTASAFAYWYGVRIPSVRQEEAFYIKYAAERAKANSE